MYFKLNMRLFILCSISLFLYTASVAQVVSSDSLFDYVDTHKKVKVCEKIFGTFVGKSGVVFLNFGGEYPNQKFVGVIFAKSLLKFPYDPAVTLMDKYVCLKGEVKEYRGKAEIIISHPKQIITMDEVNTR